MMMYYIPVNQFRSRLQNKKTVTLSVKNHQSLQKFLWKFKHKFVNYPKKSSWKHKHKNMPCSCWWVTCVVQHHVLQFQGRSQETAPLSSRSALSSSYTASRRPAAHTPSWTEQLQMAAFSLGKTCNGQQTNVFIFLRMSATVNVKWLHLEQQP